MAETPDVQAGDIASPSLRRHGWKSTLLLGLGLVTVYLANGRDAGTYDTVPTTMMVLTLARGEGVYLDRFRPILHDKNRILPVFVTGWREHIVSRYPVAPAVLVQPLAIPQVMLMDRFQPGWDRTPPAALRACKSIAHVSMAIVMSLVAIILYRFLIRLGLARVALAVTLAAALGSNLWSVASQAMWQHGPAAFGLVAAISLLDPTPVTRWRLVLAGCATAILFSCRLMDVLFVATILLWLARTQPRGICWFLPVPLLIGFLLLRYNLTYFADFAGGQAQLELLHRDIHRLPGAWSKNLLEGSLGTLFSPNRGLFIFSPWVLLALAMLTARKLRPHRLIVWLLLTLVPYLLLLSGYSVWWGGHCFGPRYWTDVMPLLAILLAFGLDWAVIRSRVVTALFALSIGLAIGVQMIGAYCFPSSWNLEPVNVDTHHERLWDWRDTELSRCLSETWAEYRKPRTAGSAGSPRAIPHGDAGAGSR
jgi:hypothetical protein